MKKTSSVLKIFVFVIMLTCVGGLIIKNGYGYYSNREINLGDAKYKCSSGKYRVNFLIWYSCWTCPKGYWCERDAKNQCPNSLTTADVGSKSKSDCDRCKENGKYYTGGKCESCPVGSYCANGVRTECKEGKTTNGKGKTRESDCIDANCKPGQYYKDHKCVTCPKDHYCDGKTMTACDRYKETNGEGKSKSSDCNCIAGYYASSSYCIICPQKSYCKNNTQYKCGKGKTTIDRGAKSKEDCVDIKCSDGEYLDGDNCKTCEAGYYCKDNKKEKCPSYYTSEKGKSLITQCYRTIAAGKEIISNKVSTCKAGTMSVERKVYYGKDSKCDDCGIKTYQDETGKSSCKACPTGYTSNPRSTTINSCYKTVKGGYGFVSNKTYKCSKGTYAKERTVNYGIDSDCKICDNGTYQSKAGQSKCEKCPDGYTSNVRETSKKNCYINVPSGYSVKSGKLSKCSKGTSSGNRAVDYGMNDPCDKCDKGEYQDEIGQRTCKKCSHGYTTKSTGSTSESACNVKIKCPKGKYLDKDNKCKVCPSGSYCSNNEKTKCPDGYTSSEEQSSINSCYKTVPAGYSLVSGNLSICATGSYYSKERKVYYGKDSKCTLCKVGYYQNKTGQSKCEKCPTGYTTKKTGQSTCVKK